MTDKLKYIHTHGRVARCWHEWELKFTECENEFAYYLCKCGAQKGTHAAAHLNRNPTATLDYLFQRCEEEGVDAKLSTYFADGHHCARIYDYHGDEIGKCTVGDKAATPQEALLTALARALGWEGDDG